MASINAFYLYKTQHSKNLELKEFHFQLIKNTLSKYGNQKHISIRRPPTYSPLRLSTRYFPSLLSPTASKTAAQRKCHVCFHTIQRETSIKYRRYQCEGCNFGLCITNFFQA